MESLDIQGDPDVLETLVWWNTLLNTTVSRTLAQTTKNNMMLKKALVAVLSLHPLLRLPMKILLTEDPSIIGGKALIALEALTILHRVSLWVL